MDSKQNRVSNQENAINKFSHFSQEIPYKTCAKVLKSSVNTKHWQLSKKRACRTAEDEVSNGTTTVKNNFAVI